MNQMGVTLEAMALLAGESCDELRVVSLLVVLLGVRAARTNRTTSTIVIQLRKGDQRMIDVDGRMPTSFAVHLLFSWHNAQAASKTRILSWFFRSL